MTAESFLLQCVSGDCFSTSGLAHPIRGLVRLRDSAQHWFGCARWHPNKVRPWCSVMKFCKAMRRSPRPRAIFRSVLLGWVRVEAGIFFISDGDVPVLLGSSLSPNAFGNPSLLLFVWTIACANTAALAYEHCESQRVLWHWLRCCALIGLREQELLWPGCCLFKLRGAGQLKLMKTPRFLKQYQANWSNFFD